MKRLKRVVLVLLILAVALLVALPYLLEIGIREAVNTQAPAMTGVDVTLGGVTVSPLSGTFGIHKLSVGNPEGFQTDRAMFLDAITVAVDLPTLIGDVIVVKDVVIDGAEITYEVGAGGGNLIVIQRKLGASGEAAPSEGSGATSGNESSDDSAVSETKKTGAAKQSDKKIKVIVEHFVLKNCMVRLSLPMLEGQSFQQPLPELELKDIGKKEGGQTVKETLSQVYAQILPLAVKTAKKNSQLPSQIMDYLSRDAKSSGAEKSLKQALEDNADKIQEKVQEKTEEALDKLQQWLKK